MAGRRHLKLTTKQDQFLRESARVIVRRIISHDTEATQVSGELTFAKEPGAGPIVEQMAVIAKDCVHCAVIEELQSIPRFNGCVMQTTFQRVHAGAVLIQFTAKARHG
jgi:hypothetical protein